jgi:hypothetical protein
MSEAISLWECFQKVPDPREASGRRHPLPAILTLASVAILAGARSLYAISQFGRDRGEGFAAALGFTRPTTPCCATLHYLFADLDRVRFDRAIRKWVRGRCQAGWRAVSLDGKTLRGTQGHELPGVHLLAAYAHEAGAVLEQIPVGAATNEHKAALRMLDLIPLAGKVVVGDAAFCQRDLSREIGRRGGDWVWTVKDNQPELKAAIALAFDDFDLSPSGAAAGRG